ncbi:MAG: thiamine pyrophosphate-dependent dehydrogenase E1 component subunit alpha [Desulfobulbus oligotrophicus]|nr:thiamine pyrophosphate-dependent dehydrogenase E1 component subunit alpha [Desulfobulbus oligotrophicus]
MQPQLDRHLRFTLLSDMVLIRAFEDRISELSRERGRLPGMQITCHGQEAIAAGVVRAMIEQDVIVTNHRSHGHMLARGVDPKTLMAEVMGKRDGLNRGKSGTLHLADPGRNVLMTSTVVGAAPLLGMGAAFAQNYRQEQAATCVFFGDGAAAEGSVHEAMNMAAVWKLPVLFVCESNRWAGAQGHDEHCPIERVADRAPGYAMPGVVVDGNDVEAVYLAAHRLLEACRAGKGPAFLECLTYRMHGHGEMDVQHYVDKDELAAWGRRDPIELYIEILQAEGLLDSRDAVEQQAVQTVDAAVAFADASPYPPPEEALEHIYVQPIGQEG